MNKEIESLQYVTKYWLCKMDIEGKKEIIK